MTSLPVLPAVDVAPIDRAFARFVARGVHAECAELLHHTALLASIERAQGNSCVDLAAHAEQPSPETAGAFRFPTLVVWQDALRESDRCAPASAVNDAALEHTPLVLDGTRLYLRRFFTAEQRLAQAIRHRVETPTAEPALLEASAPLFRRLFPRAAHEVDWQAMAAVAALRSSLVFVTGGPGTGKTTVAARLLALLLDRDATLDIAVAAPTGRAAARLTEAIGAAVQREDLEGVVGQQLPASGSTLHRLLGYTPWNEQFRFRAGNPLPHDVVIVDEASMVDVLMMDALFAALRPTARLIVLGDPDQLASVDTGFVLGDVARAASVAGGAHVGPHGPALAADYVRLSGGDGQLFDAQVNTTAPPLRDAVVRLRVSYRFGARPGIGRLATAMQEGDAEAALAVLADHTFTDVAIDPGFAADEDGRSGTWAGRLLAPVLPLLEGYLGATDAATALAALSRFRILCALREGDTGVAGLNATVERWLQVQGRRVDGWYDHRPVLITANDAGMRLFNGDVGMTLAVDGVPMVHFPLPGGGVRTLVPSRLPAHETAWAMTVHKAQGSEFDHVRFVLPASDSRILTRELLYTGITRARECVTLMGARELVRLATSRTVVRASGIVDHLTRSNG